MTTPELKQIYLDQQELFEHEKELVDREINLDRYINTTQAIVISGVRRCGKSSLLRIIKDKMKLSGSDYCYFNFDDERIPDDINLLNLIYQLHLETHDKEPVFFLDEIQNITGWQKFVNRMYEKGLKLFITGSNANLLSSEIGTYLTGRNKVLKLYPFSFTEFLKLKNEPFAGSQLSTKGTAKIKRLFAQYLKTGGFPAAVKENDPELVINYFRDILYRDIIARYNISGVEEMKQLGVYLASNVSKLFTYSKLQSAIEVKSKSTVKNYLGFYNDAFLFFYLKKYDHSIKKQMFNPQKVYAIDTALAGKLGFRTSPDSGRLLENIVYIQLLRSEKEVFYFSGKGECDFLVRTENKIDEAIQVVWALNDENKEREINGLNEVDAIYGNVKKTLLYAEADIPIPDNESIQIVKVTEWLAG